MQTEILLPQRAVSITKRYVSIIIAATKFPLRTDGRHGFDLPLTIFADWTCGHEGGRPATGRCRLPEIGFDIGTPLPITMEMCIFGKKIAEPE